MVVISTYFDRADNVGHAFQMMKQSVTSFVPSQLLLIPAGKLGTDFTPYALLIIAVGCVIQFVVSVLQERGVKIQRVPCETSTSGHCCHLFLHAGIHWLVWFHCSSERFYLCTILRKS